MTTTDDQLETIRDRVRGFDGFISSYRNAVNDVERLLVEVDRLRGRIIELGVDHYRLVDLDAHVAWYLTGTEHEHDRDSPFTRAIARHRARTESEER